MMPFVDFVFNASAILLSALAVTVLLRKRSAALRHYVLCAALVCVGIAPAVELLVPVWEVPLPLAVDQVPGAATASPTQGRVPQLERAGEAPKAVGESADTASALSVRDALIWAWAVGAAAFTSILLFGLLRLAQLTRQARPVTNDCWLAVIERLRRAYGIERPIALLETDRSGLLLVWGWRRPVLIVPTSARSWPEERIASVVSHELAHISRNDWITQLAAECVRAAHWFNPLVWIACSGLRRECEQACDDQVLSGGVDGSRFAADLLAIARDVRRSTTWAPAPAIVGTSTLERRVKAMLDQTTDRRPLTSRSRNLSLAVLLAISVAVATLAATQQFASLGGTIVDPSNGLLPGVTLVLTNEETKAKYEIRTDSSGRYEFVGLPQGTYALESKLPGFAKFNGTVTISGKNVQQDMMLSLGVVEENITILGGATATPPLTPDELELREARRREEMKKVEEMMRKRAAAASQRPPASTSGARIGGNIRVPVKLRDFKPSYPERMHGTEGDVLLTATIGKDGNVDHVEVVSATSPEFADSAIDAVKRWQFDATLLNGEAVETTMKVTLAYRWKDR
jgi:TonB family protein